MHYKRIQWSRFHGPLPVNTKLVTRATRWGNPFRYRPGEQHTPERSAELVDKYRRWLAGEIEAPDDWKYPRPSAQDIREELGRSNLACNCPLDWPCHAGVLLAMAASA